MLADALGMHLDLFQRINVDPASVSIVRYTGTRPYVLATNTHAGDLSLAGPAAAQAADARGRRRRRRGRRWRRPGASGRAGPDAGTLGSRS